MHPLTLLAIILPAAGLIVGWKVGLRRWTRRARTAADAEQVVTEILRKETPALTRADVEAIVAAYEQAELYLFQDEEGSRLHFRRPSSLWALTHSWLWVGVEPFFTIGR
jgi:hypothetical protein